MRFDTFNKNFGENAVETANANLILNKRISGKA